QNCVAILGIAGTEDQQAKLRKGLYFHVALGRLDSAGAVFHRRLFALVFSTRLDLGGGSNLGSRHGNRESAAILIQGYEAILMLVSWLRLILFVFRCPQVVLLDRRDEKIRPSTRHAARAAEPASSSPCSARREGYEAAIDAARGAGVGAPALNGVDGLLEEL